MDGVCACVSSNPSIHPSAGRREPACDTTMLDELSSPILRRHGSGKTSSRMFSSHVAVFLDCRAVLARGSPKAGVTARVRGVLLETLVKSARSDESCHRAINQCDDDPWVESLGHVPCDISSTSGSLAQKFEDRISVGSAAAFTRSLFWEVDPQASITPF